jgi:hypothetical protein
VFRLLAMLQEQLQSHPVRRLLSFGQGGTIVQTHEGFQISSGDCPIQDFQSISANESW